MLANKIGSDQDRPADSDRPSRDTEAVALGAHLGREDLCRDEEGHGSSGGCVDEIEEKSMLTATGAMLDALLGLYRVDSCSDAAIKLTRKSPAAPPIKQIRRPSLSMI